MSIFPLLQPESPEAQAMYDLFILVVLISLGIFVIVTGLIAIALWRGRSSQGIPEQEFGKTKSEIFWMTGPILILVWIFVISAKLILTMNAVPKVHPTDGKSDIELNVIGHQWWWEVRYEGTNIIAANEIHLPVGKKVRVKIDSADVIHSFWVPQLARKMDAIPGHPNYIWLEANTEGVYDGRCAEYCGTQHTWMKFKVFVKSPEEYAKWMSAAEERFKQTDSVKSVGLTESNTPTVNRSNQLAEKGKQIFLDQGCINCHSIAGISTPNIGPDLTLISKRSLIGAGVLTNSRENLARWLKDPQTYKPGCKMPDFNLTDDEVNQLVTFLESLN